MTPASRARYYIACEAFRRYGPLDPDLPRKLQRNVRRNFGVSLTRDAIGREAARCKAMYTDAAAIFPGYLRPQPGKYADPGDVRIPQFLAHLARRHPREPRRRLELLAWYVVHYEHLR